MQPGPGRAVGRAARRTAVALVAHLAPALALPGQDEPAAPPAAASPPVAADAVRIQTPLFQVDLPAGWRQLAPNEWLQLRSALPWDFPAVRPGVADIYGPVDRWLEDGFASGALVVHNTEFEGETTPAYLEQIRAHWRDAKLPDGSRREVLDARISTLGRDAHPCLEFDIRSVAPERRAVRAREFHASTSGRELILSFRAWEDVFAEADSLFQTSAATFTFPRPPSNAKDLGSRLLEAAWIGGLVGLALIALRRGLRGRTLGPADPSRSPRPTSPGSNRAENPPH